MILQHLRGTVGWARATEAGTG